MEQKISLAFKILVGLVVVGTLCVGVYSFIKNSSIDEDAQAPKYTSRDPVVTDFKNTLSPDFPKSIPLEEGVAITQSYNQDHFKYLSVVESFDSTKTMKENYALYLDFLTRDGWSISDKIETKELSNLYGTKENTDLNILIAKESSTTTPSKVSITWFSRK